MVMMCPIFTLRAVKICKLSLRKYNFFNFHSYNCNAEKYVGKSLGLHTHKTWLYYLFNML